MAKRMLLAATLAAALVAAPAGAAAVEVSGTYAVTDFGPSECVPVGASAALFRCTFTAFVSGYTGSLTGTTTLSFVQLIDCRRGKTHGHGFETFTGDVEGVGSGTLTWQTSFHADFDCTTFEPSNFTGRGSIIGGTGDLASLRGPLSFGIDTYEGVLR